MSHDSHPRNLYRVSRLPSRNRKPSWRIVPGRRDSITRTVPHTIMHARKTPPHPNTRPGLALTQARHPRRRAKIPRAPARPTAARRSTPRERRAPSSHRSHTRSVRACVGGRRGGVEGEHDHCTAAAAVLTNANVAGFGQPPPRISVFSRHVTVTWRLCPGVCLSVRLGVCVYLLVLGASEGCLLLLGLDLSVELSQLLLTHVLKILLRVRG